jgi:hypothetical protein
MLLGGRAMMKGSTNAVAVVVVAAMSLAAASCGGSGGSPSAGGQSGSGGGARSGSGGSGAGGIGDALACPGETKGAWVAMSTAMAPRGSPAPKLFWTGTDLYAESIKDAGGLFDPCANAWRATPTTPLNQEFVIPVAAASELLYFSPSRASFEGFDYRQNQELTLSLAGAIDADYAVVVSTGAKLLEWGGAVPRSGSAGWDGTQTGAIYDPAKDAWTAMTTAGAPAARVAPGVWTGSELAIWGGHSADTYMNGMYRYDCATNAYTDKANDCIQYGDGALYDPARDVWTQIETAGAPKPRFEHLLAWTGDRVLVWGGGEQGTPDPTLLTPAKQWLSDGGMYDPVAKAWTAVAASPLPDSGYQLSAYWLLWSGDFLATGSKPLEGWLFDPHANSWSTLDPPAAGVTSCEVSMTAQVGALVAVCTIDSMRTVVLRPAGESAWRSYPLPSGVAPTPSVLWTGKRLFVWGGTFPPTFTCPPPSPQMPGCDPPPPTYSNVGFMLLP